MNEIILREDELKLLSYLHQHARGYAPRYALPLADVATALGWDEARCDKAASYLQQWDLVAFPANTALDAPAPEAEHRGAFPPGRVFLTGQGENFMRLRERRLERGSGSPDEPRPRG